MKTFILLISLVLTFVFGANAQSTLKGQIFSAETGKEIPFAQIMLYHNYELVSRSTSNEIGEYLNNNLDKRYYDIVITCPGKVPIFINDELLIERSTTLLNFFLIDQAQMPINALKFSAPSATGHEVENNINISEKQKPIVVQKEIAKRNKNLDALPGFVECGCLREGCIHTLPPQIICHLGMTRAYLTAEAIRNLPTKSIEEMKGIGRFRPNVYFIDGERSDLIRRQKKYWFTPLDSIGPQGLTPEYSTSPRPIGHPSPFWRREDLAPSPEMERAGKEAIISHIKN